ncbi:Hypothetical Protein FCC1311_036932 [Hondaea fermentalgiana]|uniref:Radical SAM core domain-containing protein n=1 Tax=Hondaea fermentalgiana TaxID=2315210 RepID=A0A2R5GGS5_9STRA|nr:Hypothetical Protein FCC1311_036932 [Hondaea fermentalgiana]|eukprot:GBG27471.1 Hypothetical Protein FCC1311_036932 [Hondaea fermentalgiana]
MSARPGLVYWLGSKLYLGVTNRCNAVPIIVQRGPSFSMPEDSGFAKLPEDEEEPTAQDMFEAVDNAYASDPRKKMIGMGENDEGVTFAGYGEPLLRLDTILEAAQIIRETRHGVPLRIKTNGLMPGGDNASAAQQLAAAGIKSASVFLPGADPNTFAKFAQAESPELNFGMVCDFIGQLSEAGLDVECTTVKRDGIDVSAVRQLAMALGATETRAVSFHP